MKTNPNDAAFARPHSEDKHHGDAFRDQNGLTKLEYFCASSLQGLSLNASYFDHSMHRAMANAAISIAKALIDELNKQDEENNER